MQGASADKLHVCEYTIISILQLQLFAPAPHSVTDVTQGLGSLPTYEQISVHCT